MFKFFVGQICYIEYFLTQWVIMIQNSKKWKILYETKYEVYWQTSKKKNKECDYVISSRGMDIYYTKKEFEEHIYAVNRVCDELYKQNGRCCYQ